MYRYKVKFNLLNLLKNIHINMNQTKENLFYLNPALY